MNNMDTAEKIEIANQILGAANVNRIKVNDGLLEHAASSKSFLTNDNRELLMG